MQPLERGIDGFWCQMSEIAVWGGCGSLGLVEWK
jgi:hypothetical protein